MGKNILITGAAGYIGGSVLADFISRTSGPIKAARLSAAVRSDEQVQSLSKLGVNVIQVDLGDETAVKEVVISNKIDIVVHTATAIDGHAVSALIKALGQRRQLSGEETYYIHSSIASVFAEENGWPYGEIRDSDPIYEKEKELGDAHIIRKVNILVTELAREQGVTSMIIPVPQVYGRGTGEWRKLSVSIPASIRASIKHKVVYQFDTDGHPPSVHISDLVVFYALLTENILQKKPIPRGEKGYYFAIGHRTHWWEFMQRLAECLHARGLVRKPRAETWPSDEVAADYLGFPRLYVRAMGTSSGDLVPVNAYQLGWQPEWDEKRFIESVDDEVQAVLELDTVKSTLFDTVLSKE
ncbi:hypothetical protein UA08_01113 [Talaromyces atroroseus]|uniref:NAD-dependent epimerase/dehydratase domain-containing protein n=1 Tax=Talaromyces atroroseus TaxID=1441469 RepID=A0A225B8Y6_TALAT|nr:hypothetical protein UA08_01113 [Talaromyces atroroseus]OKL63856.1 hypothetical protein UA08_01113 [Talaromyces atroroseus]